MSKYTSQLRYICEAKSGFTPEQLEEKSIDQIVEAAAPQIFNFTFPIYKEEFRVVLEHEILFHFYLQEIGAETYGQFQYYLARKLREIMPYYNQLYASAELEFDPFHDVDYTKTHGGRLTGNKQTAGNVTGHSTTEGETTDNSETETSGAGAMQGTSTSNRVKNTTGTDVTDTTTENDGTGNITKSGTEQTNTTTENDGRGTRNETIDKDTSNSYTKSTISRDAYSDTPQTSVLGVEGDGSGSPTNNVSDNYYLTNYRKITGSETGSGTGSEDTTDAETTTTHNEGTGVVVTTRSESEDSTTHAEGSGNTTTNRTGNETETVNGTTGENTTTSGHSETAENGTSSSETNATTDSTGSEEYVNTDDYIDRVYGKMGTTSYSQLLNEFRETFLNINKMIFDELEVLFMGIY